MHTEEQAKKLWCPEARQASRQDGIVTVGNSASIMGRGEQPEVKYALCIASGCMHWRWIIVQDIMKENTGYCGLSGRP